MFAYSSEQIHFTQMNGKVSEVREQVEVKDGKGTITVTKMHNGKKVRKSHPLTRKQIRNIQNKKFMPGLFRPCLNGCDEALGLTGSKLSKPKNTSLRLRHKTRKMQSK